MSSEGPIALIRYGLIAEVARFDASEQPHLDRGSRVVVETHRGCELGTVLDIVRSTVMAEDRPQLKVLRKATPADEATALDHRRSAPDECRAWDVRIGDWKLDLQLIDVEWTLDRSKLILYVLNERGPECTKLALQAAAAGLGLIEVQPVSQDGPVTLPPAGGGCGSGGCGTGGGCHSS